MTLDDITLKEILHPRNHWSTRRGFWPHSLRIFCVSFGLVATFLITLSAILSAIEVPTLKTWLSQNTLYFLLSPLATVSVYWIIFWLGRTWWKIVFSRKMNVVFAHNLECAPEFVTRYDELIEDLRNQLRESNLGGEINIQKKPPDIHFKNRTAAEAKTQLGLHGSTLLIWGHSQKTG